MRKVESGRREERATARRSSNQVRDLRCLPTAAALLYEWAVNSIPVESDLRRSDFMLVQRHWFSGSSSSPILSTVDGVRAPL